MTTAAPMEALPVGTAVLVDGFVYHAAEPNANEWAPQRNRYLLPLVRPEGQRTGATPGRRVLVNAQDIRYTESEADLHGLLREQVEQMVKAELTLANGRGVSPETRKRIAHLAAEAVRQKLAGCGRLAYVPGRLLPSVPESVGGSDIQISQALGRLLNPRGV